MNWAALRRLIRRALRGPGSRGRSRRATRRAALKDDMAWLGEILPATPPPESVECEAWQPRIARWIRLAFPMVDDTVQLVPVPAAMILDLMAGTFTWDPQ